jgi:putative hydrolase of the HAD superfamily
MKIFDAIIFDLGNVIIDIDYKETLKEFNKLSNTDFSKIVSFEKQHELFDLFETGHVTSAEFRNELKQFLKPDVTDAEIDNAWNAIFIGFPKHKIELLKTLKQTNRIYALSNINKIHEDEIDRIAVRDFGANAFADFFHHAYYSHIVGFRKPHKEIYELVLKSESLNPARTFFVDDKEENVLAAKQLGIQAYQLGERHLLNELLTEAGVL